MSPELRRRVLRDSLTVGATTGAYGVSFGALSAVSGLSVAQTCALSLLLFSGGSQFALVGILGSGGSPAAAVTTSTLLAARNGLYAVRLAPLLRLTGWRRLLGAHIVLDESTAMALAQPRPDAARFAFRVTGVAVFLLWNLMTLLGALGADALGDPRQYGLDAAGPAAFIGLVAPRLRGRDPWLVAGAAAVLAAGVAPFVPAGVPVLVAAGVALAVGLRR
ncbi:MAG: hypothetical protein QOJ92_522 [Frankiales bacterium]|nr:hypothetical protein [Frankiales bacterium]